MTVTVSTSIGFALTGQELALDDADITAAGIVAGLAGMGWDAQAVRRQAEQAWADELAWPHPVPPHSLDAIGAARWYALLAQVRSALGVEAIHLPPSRRTTLTADEKRLLDDLPPHHGLVG